jgi:type II secretory pathway pseudopilin PulG
MVLNYKKHFNGGFSFLEVLIAIGISVLLGAISFYALQGVNNKEVLDKSALSVVALLEQTRASTLASKNASEYGVHFDTNQMVMFTGSTYNISNSSNVVVPINEKVNVSNFNLVGGGHDVIFKRLTGASDTSGTITLSLVASSTTSKIITIHKTGIVERN